MKILLFFFSFVFVLYAETTMCYKKNLPTKNIYENISLNGTNCNGKSINKLEQNGWKLVDSKITKNKLNLFNHIYIFKKETPIVKELTKSIFDPSLESYIISNTTNTTATISAKNIQVGETGIIVHRYKNNNKIILTNAFVSRSNNKGSTIEFTSAKFFDQKAIPTTLRKPQDGDIFILHHLYDTSLMIVPNLESKQIINKIYKKQNFINEDLFATYLKIDQNPVPTKKDIQKFCLENQIGTIFFVVEDTLYIVDPLTFIILYTQDINIEDTKTTVPFFSNIKEIQKGFWDITGKSSIEDYNRYYKAMITNTIDLDSDDINIIKTIKELWPW